MNIPKDKTVCYDNLTVSNLNVRGHLKVKGILTAKHIQGCGYIEAGEVVCDTLRAGTLRAEIATAQKIAVKKLFVRDCRASAAIVATDFAESSCMQTGKLTAALFSISDLKANELVVLPQKKRGMLGTLFASWVRTLFCRSPKGVKDSRPSESKPERKPKDRTDELVDKIIEALEARGYFSAPPAQDTAAPFPTCEEEIAA